MSVAARYATINHMPPEPATYITVAKAAHILQASPAEVAEMATTGDIPSAEVDGKVMVSRRVVLAKAGQS